MNKKIYDSVMDGKHDNNISFSDFQNLIIDLGLYISVKMVRI